MSSAFTWNLFLFYQSKKSAINFMKSAREEADLNLQKNMPMNIMQHFCIFLYLLIRFSL